MVGTIVEKKEELLKRREDLVRMIRVKLNAPEKAISLVDFFCGLRKKNIFQLVLQEDINAEELSLILRDGSNPAKLEFVSYSAIAEDLIKQIEERSGRDSSVRATLIEQKRIDMRSVFFCPGIVLNGHSGANSWGMICCFLQAAFLTDELLSDGNGNMAYYWYDALKMFGHYLDLLFATEKKKDLVPLLDKCEQVLGFISQCIPLGWKPNSLRGFVVLCQ